MITKKVVGNVPGYLMVILAVTFTFFFTWGNPHGYPSLRGERGVMPDSYRLKHHGGPLGGNRAGRRIAWHFTATRLSAEPAVLPGTPSVPRDREGGRPREGGGGGLDTRRHPAPQSFFFFETRLGGGMLLRIPRVAVPPGLCWAQGRKRDAPPTTN